MPPEHHDINETACSSCQGSSGSNLASGKVCAIQIWIATLSLKIFPSTMRSGTLCFGLIFKYSGEVCSPFLKYEPETSHRLQ